MADDDGCLACCGEAVLASVSGGKWVELVRQMFQVTDEGLGVVMEPSACVLVE